MAQAVYINLPVADFDRPRRFFEAMGYSFNAQSGNDPAAGA